MDNLSNIEKNKTEPTNEVLEHVKKEIKKRNRPDLEKFGQENVEAGYNSLVASFTDRLDQFEPIDLSDHKQVEKRIQEYRSLCMEFDEKQTVSALSDALGFDRRRMWEIVNDIPGRNLYVSQKSRDLIKKAYRKLEVQWEQLFMNGKINPVSGIFIAKNHFGYKDTQDITIRPDSPYGEQKSIEQIQQEYDALPE